VVLISAPGGFFLSNDAFFYGVLPVLVQAGKLYGFTPFEVGYASLLGQAFHMLSPLTAFIYLLLSMTQLDMGEWQRACFGWCVAIFAIFIATARRLRAWCRCTGKTPTSDRGKAYRPRSVQT
jgi:CitMHS family citrate-Mg2+:H+ or citrate-Ca2+:H+ symporter